MANTMNEPIYTAVCPGCGIKALLVNGLCFVCEVAKKRGNNAG